MHVIVPVILPHITAWKTKASDFLSTASSYVSYLEEKEVLQTLPSLLCSWAELLETCEGVY